MNQSDRDTREDDAREPDAFGAWQQSLLALTGRIARGLRAALIEAARGRSAGARSPADAPPLDRPVSQGAGDVTYGLDLPAETAIAAWFEEEACLRPLSVLTEDAGWRHLGPDGRGGSLPLAGFDHGGPRIAFDPVDGTRNLMADLRSAWTVVAFAPPGAAEPRYRDVSAGIVAELPTTREATRRILSARRGGACRLEERSLAEDAPLYAFDLRADADDRADNGYFPFFRYQPALRPAIAALEAEFLGRLERFEHADPATCYDDQYITSAGQMVLLSLGTYRVVVDARPAIAARLGVRTTTAKPYDVAGAFLVAEAAGAVVTDLNGEPLDFPLDCTTPIAFAGWANPATRARLLPHLRAALARPDAS